MGTHLAQRHAVASDARTRPRRRHAIKRVRSERLIAKTPKKQKDQKMSFAFSLLFVFLASLACGGLSFRCRLVFLTSSLQKSWSPFLQQLLVQSRGFTFRTMPTGATGRSGGGCERGLAMAHSPQTDARFGPGSGHHGPVAGWHDFRRVVVLSRHEKPPRMDRSTAPSRGMSGRRQ